MLYIPCLDDACTDSVLTRFCTTYRAPPIPFFFFYNDRAPPEIYPLPLPAALPIPLETRRGVVGDLDLLRTDARRIAPAVVAKVAVSRERRGALLETAPPDDVGIVGIRGNRCACSAGEDRSRGCDEDGKLLQGRLLGPGPERRGFVGPGA